jgi:hypothetical protein
MHDEIMQSSGTVRHHMRDESTSEPLDDEPTWETRELELLYDVIRDELSVYDGAENLGITDEAIRTLARAVTTRLDYAFSVKWSPDWVVRGRPHVWLYEDGWHARCNECLQESPVSSSEHGAVSWFDNHAEHIGTG